MASTSASRRAIFRQIAQREHVEWPTYDSTPIYDRTSLAGLHSDVRIVSETWFTHPNHDSVEQFVLVLPLAYFSFEAHDRYTRSTCYEMDSLFRVFVLKELHGLEHETALYEYLDNCSIENGRQQRDHAVMSLGKRGRESGNGSRLARPR
ncbi:hypothetical protein [Halorubrum trapanicum]|uniref:hypothetical protein n=1 Tax=Halorubrum trapanicum TaxID=29284 RepID=UPI003CD070BE